MAKLKHIAIASQEPKKTAEFYRSVFGLKQVGNVEGDNAEGVYLSDGDISIAILKFKNETLAGLDYGVEFSGLHHIGFQVDDLSEADARLQAAEVEPSSDINSVRRSEMGEGTWRTKRRPQLRGSRRRPDRRVPNRLGRRRRQEGRQERRAPHQR